MVNKLPKSILLTGVGCPGGTDIISCLRKQKDLMIYGTDIRSNVPAKYFLDEFIITSPRNNSEFITQIKKIIQEKSIDIVWPLPTFEQKIFSTHKKELIPAEIIVSEPKAIDVCNDKYRLYNEVKNTYPELVPKTYLVSNATEFSSTISKFNYPENPICIRQLKSTGAKGFKIIDKSYNSLDILLGNTPSEHYISYEEAMNAYSNDRFNPFMIQEFLPGDEWDVDCLSSNGETYFAITRKNLSMNTSLSYHSKLESNEELSEISNKIINYLGLSYICSVTFKYNKDSKPRLIEINPRIPASITATLSTGVNLLLEAINISKGNKPSSRKVKYGNEYFRYFSYVLSED